MEQFNFVSAEGLIARLEDELSSYNANGLLDTGKLYTQLKYLSQLLGIAAFEKQEYILKLENHTVELPCDFYLLDSAWLCDPTPQQYNLNFQSKLVVYTETIDENVCNVGNCYLPSSNCLYPVSVSACNQDKVLDKTTTREYVYSSNTPITWKNPILLKLNNQKSVKNLCSKDCQNLFSNSPYEISISKKGDSYYLTSVLKDPIIYIKYYGYSKDEYDIPLVPDNQIIQEAYFSHLQYYFFRMMYINGDDANLENKLKFLKEESENKVAQAITFSKFPSFNKAINTARRSRKKFASYEIMNIKHL